MSQTKISKKDTWSFPKKEYIPKVGVEIKIFLGEITRTMTSRMSSEPDPPTTHSLSTLWNLPTASRKRPGKERVREKRKRIIREREREKERTRRNLFVRKKKESKILTKERERKRRRICEEVFKKRNKKKRTLSRVRVNMKIWGFNRVTYCLWRSIDILICVQFDELIHWNTRRFRDLQHRIHCVLSMSISSFFLFSLSFFSHSFFSLSFLSLLVYILKKRGHTSMVFQIQKVRPNKAEDGSIRRVSHHTHKHTNTFFFSLSLPRQSKTTKTLATSARKANDVSRSFFFWKLFEMKRKNSKSSEWEGDKIHFLYFDWDTLYHTAATKTAMRTVKREMWMCVALPSTRGRELDRSGCPDRPWNKFLINKEIKEKRKRKRNKEKQKEHTK